MKNFNSKEQSRLPTVAAAVLALLATSPGASASDSNTLLPPVVAKKPNEDDHTPNLVLAPPADSGTLFADHSSHASHSSHYSSSGGGDYTPYTPPVPTPAPTYVPPPTPYTPPAPVPAPDVPSVSRLDPVLLNKLTQVPTMWPRQVKLLQRFGFTEIKDGVAVGLVGAPAGTLVDLIQVKSARLVVSYLGNKAEIDAGITDIADRIDINALVAAPIPGPSTNAGATTPPPSVSPGTTP